LSFLKPRAETWQPRDRNPAGGESEAEKEYKADQVNLQIQTNDEDSLHTKNLTAIRK